MSAFDVFCAVWRFIARLLQVVVETAIDTVTTIGKAAIELLVDVIDMIGDGLTDWGIGSWILIALGAYLVFTLVSNKRDEDPGRISY